MLVLHLASGPVRGAAWAANRWHAWRGRHRIERLPAITVAATANYYRAFTAPNPDYKANLQGAGGEPVGTACYALSPLQDRVYLFELEIAAEHRRRGYGTALLGYLARTYGQPITPVAEPFDARRFWAVVRGLPGLMVTEGLSAGEMADEARRWRHLWPDAVRLERVITERLFTHHEPWEVAVGRGLESDGG